jgi:CelD/BcsL family acetyltransferase involved in cellulose biosynthesis
MSRGTAADGDDVMSFQTGDREAQGLQRASVVSAARELDELSSDWRGLAESQGNCFITPEWFFAWRRHLGRGTVPHVITLRSAASELEGCLPLVSSSVRPRVVSFAGRELGDLFGPCAMPGREADVARQIAPLLFGMARDRTVVLDRVDRSARWISELVLQRPRGCTSARFRPSVAWRLPLDGMCWDDYLGSRSKNFRDQANGGSAA